MSTQKIKENLQANGFREKVKRITEFKHQYIEIKSISIYHKKSLKRNFMYTIHVSLLTPAVYAEQSDFLPKSTLWKGLKKRNKTTTTTKKLYCEEHAKHYLKPSDQD